MNIIYYLARGVVFYTGAIQGHQPKDNSRGPPRLGVPSLVPYGHFRETALSCQALHVGSRVRWEARQTGASPPNGCCGLSPLRVVVPGGAALAEAAGHHVRRAALLHATTVIMIMIMIIIIIMIISILNVCIYIYIYIYICIYIYTHIYTHYVYTCCILKYTIRLFVVQHSCTPESAYWEDAVLDHWR